MPLYQSLPCTGEPCFVQPAIQQEHTWHIVADIVLIQLLHDEDPMLTGRERIISSFISLRNRLEVRLFHLQQDLR
ncbi:hypothetical protein D3C72_1409940 [compost metagenome]